MPKTTHPLHFEDLSWNEFERMIFAYITKLRNWKSIDWYGQKGSDSGRDIWGEFEGESYCYQCANYRKLVLNKAIGDIDKLAKNNFLPTYFILVCGGRVTAKTRTKIYDYARISGIKSADIWDGPKLEEKLRSHAPDLIKRFFWSENFPEIHNNQSSNSSKVLDQISRQNIEVLNLLKRIIPDEEKKVTISHRSTTRTSVLIELAKKPFDFSQIGNPFKGIVATVLLIERFIADIGVAEQTGLSNSISRVFIDFFRGNSLNQDFFSNHVRKLAFLVFDVNEIENKEPVQLTINTANIGEFVFNFPEKILEFVLFELFVNAKQNRWVSIDSDFINKLDVTVTSNADIMKIRLKNTGPPTKAVTLAHLNSVNRMKKNREVTGIYLIKMMFEYFEIGKINFSSEKINTDLEWFIVELTLSSWHEKDHNY